MPSSQDSFTMIQSSGLISIEKKSINKLPLSKSYMTLIRINPSILDSIAHRTASRVLR